MGFQWDTTSANMDLLTNLLHTLIGIEDCIEDLEDLEKAGLEADAGGDWSALFSGLVAHYQCYQQCVGHKCCCFRNLVARVYQHAGLLSSDSVDIIESPTDFMESNLVDMNLVTIK